MNVTANINIKETVESQVVHVLRTTGYTLNAVNNYGDNLLHISAANGCSKIVKEIFKNEDNCRIIDRKNKCGWTPLMQAIRSGDIDTVKLFLKHKVNLNKFTYLGMSVLGLAAAINGEMFETIYKKCPSTLTNARSDDINPLCIAAIKNDKDLFFTLLDLGLEPNEYTHIIMKQSTVREIRKLAKPQLSIEDYWNDTSDNIVLQNNANRKKKEKCSATLLIENSIKSPNNDLQKSEQKCKHRLKNNNEICLPKCSQSLQPIIVDCYNSLKPKNKNDSYKEYSHGLNLFLKQPNCQLENVISPTLTYTHDTIFPTSPNISFVKIDSNERMLNPFTNNTGIKCTIASPPIILKRLQYIRPPDLHIKCIEEDLDNTLTFTPQFSPNRSPCIPPDINDENVFGENTPTPPHYKTPPRGVLNTQNTKMINLLKHFELSHHIPIFLEQEIDIDLFVTLTDEDLIEIGIENKMDRNALLAVIKKYKGINVL